MKMRLILIIVLFINFFIVMCLNNRLIEDVAEGGNLGKLYIEVANKIQETQKSNNVLESDSLIEQEIETSTTKHNIEQSKNVEINNINTVMDNQKIGIVITNNGNLHFNSIEFVSDGIINIYYGKNFQNIKTYNHRILINGKSYFKNSNRIKITSDKKITIKGLSKAAFDGSFYVYREDNEFIAVNEISIEKYLFGVVSSEMPLSFEKEALKAQAVCARTYTYAHLDNSKYKKYNAIMDDTVNYQAYGNTKVTKKVKDSVKSTRGEVLTSKGKLINAYYFSTSCGYTTDAAIWGNKELSYLKSKYVSKEKGTIDVLSTDYFNQFIKNKQEAYEKDCSFYRWKVTIKAESIKNKLYEICEENIGDVKGISISRRGAGGIVSEVEIIGNNGKCVINNQNKIRQVFSPKGCKIILNDGSERSDFSSLPSAFFVIDKKSDSEYMLTGGGFGHGSGMSQYGAHEMAKNGKKYNEILSFFYTDVTCGHTNIH